MNGQALSALLKVKLSAIWLSIVNTVKSKKKGGKGGAFKGVMYILVLLFSVCLLMFYFALLFFSVCDLFAMAGISWFYFAMAGALSLIMCFVGSIFTTQAYIFKARDNDLLLSMPIRPAYILVSRMTSVLLLDYFYSFMVMIPAGVVYLLLEPVTVPGVIIFIICAIVLPLLSQALACVAAWVLEMITSRIKSKNLFTIILSLGGLALYFLVVSKLSGYITMLMENGVEIANAVKKGFFPLFYLGSAITEHNFLSIIIVALVCFAPFALAYYILSKNFIRLVSTRRTAAKKKYVEKKLSVRSPRVAFMLKDMQKFTSSATYMLNAGLGGVLALIGAAVIPAKVGELSAEFMIVGIWVDSNILAAAFSAAILCAGAAMNYISAPSLSLEAKTIWIIKTVPLAPKEILLGKAYSHICITAPFVLVGGIVSCIVGKITGTAMIIVFALPLAYTVFGGLFGITMNVIFPKFDWENEAKVIKQSASAMLTTVISMALLLVFFGGYIALVFYYEITIGIIEYLWYLTGFLAVVDLLLYLYICKGGSKRFEKMGA